MKFNMKFKPLHFLSVSIILCINFLHCSDYNPFTDYNNAKVVITKKTFASGDTIPIFSTETLSYVIAVPELADSVKINVVSNRMGAKEKLDKAFILSSQEPHKLLLSFYQTGPKEIEFTTFRHDGEVVSYRELLYVISPLKQKTVNGLYGKEMKLSTRSVHDSDVVYIWKIGDTLVKSKDSAETVILNKAPSHGQGILYVTDGLVESPLDTFSYFLTDNSVPQIRFLDSALFNKDTLIVGGKDFHLKLSITDIGSDQNLKATINGEPLEIFQDSIYVKVFTNIDTMKTVKQWTVIATDNSNLSDTAICWIRYDQSSKTSKSIALSVQIPSSDSSDCPVNKRTFYGKVDRYSKDTLPVTLFFYNNGIVTDSLHVKSNDWEQQVRLNTTENKIMVIAKKGKESDTVYRKIHYDSLSTDNDDPVILDMYAEGYNDRTVVPVNKVTLKVIAFDEGSGIDTLTCNGVTFTRKSEYLWENENVALKHTLEGNVFQLEAKDKKGHVATKQKMLYYNKVPVVTGKPLTFDPLVSGKTFTASIQCEDEDELTYSLMSGDSSFTLNGGKITWTPSIKDTGDNRFVVKISDGYDLIDRSEEIYDTIDLFVVDSSKISGFVDFGFPLNTFPVLLQANVDTMRVGIRPLKGNPEYSYLAVISGSRDTIPVVKDTLIWVPDIRDTGAVKIEIVVTDFFNYKDTIVPVIQVIPANRPLKLKFTKSADTLADGSLNMKTAGKIISIPFVIEDPDSYNTEKFTAIITQAGKNDTIAISKTLTFDVNVKSSLLQYGIDTLTVTAFDRVGHLSTQKLIVNYGVLPIATQLMNPQLFDSGKVQLFWKNSSPGPDFHYELFLAQGNGDMELKYRGTDTSYLVKVTNQGLVCFWQVNVCNGKECMASAVQSFKFPVPELEIDTLVKENFKTLYIALLDTIRLPLKLKKGTNSVAYTATLLPGDKQLLIQNGEVQFVPQSADNGWRKISVIAKDANYLISDTMICDLYIAPSTIELVVTENPDLTGRIDLRSMTEKFSIVFTIKTNSDFRPDATVEIIQRDASHTFNVGENNTFTMVIDPLSDLESEIIDINVKEAHKEIQPLHLELYILYNTGAENEVKGSFVQIEK